MGIHCFLGQIMKENNGIVKVPLASVWKIESWSLLLKFQDILFFILFAAAVNERLKNLPIVIHYHYENTPIQYTAIFHSFKNDYCQMKSFDIFSYFCSKHRLCVHVRTASVKRF